MPPAASRPQTLLVLGLFLATVLPLAILLTRQPSGEMIRIEPPPPTATPHALRVYVSGAVVNPDVYLLPPDSIAKDAVQAAGGKTDDADEAVMNLAQPLRDGDHLYIPHRGEAIRPTSLAPRQTAPVPNGPTSAIPATGMPAGQIDINTASAEELDRLPYIGPTLAQAIVDYREKNGPFRSIEEIMNVPRIGPAAFAKIKEFICVCSLHDFP